MISVTHFVAIASFLSFSVRADKNIVLAPLSTDASLPEKMMIFIPGGKVPTDNYIETAKSIQLSATGLRLWVTIPAVFQKLCIISCTATAICSPLHSAVESALTEADGKGWKRGHDDKDIFLAGHSLGGVCANTLFQAYTSGTSYPYAAVIEMGSYVDESGDHDLTHYPVPVLTLNVELDGGLARPGKTAVWWKQHVELQASMGEDQALKQKPVIVLPKLNHSDFCPGFDVPGDLKAEVDQATASAAIGEVVAAFLHLQTPEIPAATKAASLGVIREKVEWTKTLLTPYLKAQALERTPSDTRASPEGAGPFCAQAQHIIAGLTPTDDARLTVQDGFHISSPNLEHCHPNYTAAEGGGLLVDSCSHTDYYTDIMNTGSITAASEIACKMLSSDRIAQQLKTKAADPKVQCSKVNEHAVRIAEQLASESTLKRFKASGRGWCFLEDTETWEDVGPLWVFKDALTLKESSKCMSVSSASLRTAIDGRIFPGNTYCKVLSPARVLDWMMTDSLKPGKDDDLAETKAEALII